MQVNCTKLSIFPLIFWLHLWNSPSLQFSPFQPGKHKQPSVKRAKNLPKNHSFSWQNIAITIFYYTSCPLLKMLMKPLLTPDKLLHMSHLLQSIVHLKSNYAVDILKHRKNLLSSDCHRDIGPSHTVHDHYNP